MLFKAWQLIKGADVINLHAPQMDAASIALISKLQKKPMVLTYHCDLQMPAGWFNQLAGWAASQANRITAYLADAIVHNTRDFAEHSPFLKKFLDKLTVIQPPIVVESISQAEIAAFRKKYAIQPDRRIIGMVARLATEKGVEFLVQAMPKVLELLPDAQVVFVGEYQHVFGEQAYREKLLPMIEALADHWIFLGVVNEVDKSAFYQLTDVLVLPSINSTESFGMVQIEALISGTPVVATDLPGVRQPVLTTDMGMIVPVMDAPALASAILSILTSGMHVDSEKNKRITDFYAPQTVAEAYDLLYRRLVGDYE